MDSYLDAVLSCLEKWKGKLPPLDTIYFGGGTPSLFGGQRIEVILDSIKNNFDISENAEITVECNPSSVSKSLPFELASAGVNRISMGMQSAVESERKAIGRVSSPEQVGYALGLIKKAGIENVSLDLMLALPGQTTESLDESIAFAAESGAKHISAYILKLENGTCHEERPEAV